MKLLFTSDLHGLDSAYVRFSELLKEVNYDIGVLGGDLMGYPSELEVESAKGDLRQSDKMAAGDNKQNIKDLILEIALQNKQKYYKAILRQAGKPIVFIMGNDDGILGLGRAWTSEGKFVDINQRRAKHGKYNLVGYHYTSPFVGGVYEKTVSDQENDFSILEEMIDHNTILVSHGPPLGILDTAADGKHVGSKALLDLVERTSPRLHLFGHIHSNFGNNGSSVNGAYPHSRKFVSVNVDTLQMESIG